MKPILFNAEMVRAILSGRKTCTRRLVKPAALLGLQDEYRAHLEGYTDEEIVNLSGKPYYPGDILYVRETWFEYAGQYVYKATAAQPELWNGMWHPSIHMPKEAARIFLCVTDVRAERLQSIKTWQCVDEGAVKKPNYTKRHDLVCHNRYRTEFAKLWDSTVKPADLPLYGWEANPWVWVIGFKRCEKPCEAK